MREAIPLEPVVAFKLHFCSGGMAYYSTYSHWVDYGENHRDVRAPSLLIPEIFEEMLSTLGQKPVVIRSEGDYDAWLQRGGWATVSRKTAYKLMPQWLKKHECLKGANGVYTALELCSPNASKHAAHRGKRNRVLARDGRRCRDCGATEEDSDVKLTMHHVGAFSHGYETTSPNLVALCERCNQGRGDWGNRFEFDVPGLIRGVDLSLIGRKLSRDDIYLALKISDNLMRARCEVW